MDAFRNSEETFGQAVHETYAAREAVWEVEEKVQSRQGQQGQESWPAKGSSRQLQHSPKGESKGARSQGEKPAEKGQALRVAKTLKDGTRLCGGFQRQQCSNKPSNCADGKHFCGGLQENSRVCGGRHPSKVCTNPKVKKCS